VQNTRGGGGNYASKYGIYISMYSRTNKFHENEVPLTRPGTHDLFKPSSDWTRLVFLHPVPSTSPAAVPACPTSILKTKTAVCFEMRVNPAKLHYAKSWRHCPYKHVQLFLHHSAVNVRWPANSICRRRCRGGTALRQVETKRERGGPIITEQPTGKQPQDLETIYRLFR
jgi:hypothetical protein